MTRRFWWCLVLPGLIGCSSWERVSQTFPGAVGRDVPHARWTRDGRLYSHFETVGLVSATLLSDPVAQRLAAIVARETPGRTVTDIVGFAPAVSQATVLLILTAQHRRWRVAAPPDAPWSFVLRAGAGPPLVPERVRPLRPPVGFERFFPAWNPWSSAALLTFALPATALSGDVELSVQAVGGRRTKLGWP